MGSSFWNSYRHGKLLWIYISYWLDLESNSSNTASRYCSYTAPTPSLPTPDIRFYPSFNPEHWVNATMTISNFASFPSGCSYSVTATCPEAGNPDISMSTSGSLKSPISPSWHYPNIANGMVCNIKLTISKSGYKSVTYSDSCTYNY